jgi:hypothetical protein
MIIISTVLNNENFIKVNCSLHYLATLGILVSIKWFLDGTNGVFHEVSLELMNKDRQERFIKENLEA